MSPMTSVLEARLAFCAESTERMDMMLFVMLLMAALCNMLAFCMLSTVLLIHVLAFCIRATVILSYKLSNSRAHMRNRPSVICGDRLVTVDIRYEAMLTFAVCTSCRTSTLLAMQ